MLMPFASSMVTDTTSSRLKRKNGSCISDGAVRTCGVYLIVESLESRDTFASEPDQRYRYGGLPPDTETDASICEPPDALSVATGTKRGSLVAGINPIFDFTCEEAPVNGFVSVVVA